MGRCVWPCVRSHHNFVDLLPWTLIEYGQSHIGGFMRILIISLALIVMSGCSKSTTPLKDAGCAVESTLTASFGSTIVAQCAGTDAAACGASLQAALGNINLCLTPIPSPTPSIQSVGAFKTVGDVSQSDLNKAKGPRLQDVHAMGVVGAVVCPLAYSAIEGLLTGIVPKACGCTKNLDAGAIGTGLVTACLASVPI